MWSRADCVDAGGLMSYGHNDSSVMRQIASIVDKILNGMATRLVLKHYFPPDT